MRVQCSKPRYKPYALCDDDLAKVQKEPNWMPSIRIDSLIGFKTFEKFKRKYDKHITYDEILPRHYLPTPDLDGPNTVIIPETSQCRILHVPSKREMQRFWDCIPVFYRNCRDILLINFVWKVPASDVFPFFHVLDGFYHIIFHPVIKATLSLQNTPCVLVAYNRVAYFLHWLYTPS